MGSSNVTADILSRPNQVIGSEWTLHQEVVDHLVHKWPAVIDLFATSLTARLRVYFSPASDPRAAWTDALLQPWDNLQAYAFPPIAIIRRVLVKLRSSRNCELTLIAPFWPQREWFPELLELLSDVPIALSSRKDLLRQPHFHRFHQNLPKLQLTAWRLSSDSPVRPASLLRWLDNLSSVEDSPHAWIIRLDGVHIESGAGTSVIDRPHLPFPKLLNFLPICSSAKGLPSLPSKDIGPCCRWSSSFPFRRSLPLLSLKTSFGLLRYLLHGPFSFLHLGIWIKFWSISQVRHLSPLREHLFWTKPRRPCSFSPWLLLNGFRSSRPCHSLCHSRVRTWSCIMTRSSVLRWSLPPILYLVLSLFRLSDFAGDLPERVQCPVRAIKFLRKAARSASYIPSRLFVSPRNPERAMSKNAISFYLRQLITDSGAVSSSRPPRAHDIRGIATSLNYYSNLSVSHLMQVATWKSNRVFASRYLKEVSATQDNIRRFGPLVIAGDKLHPRPPQHKH